MIHEVHMSWSLPAASILETDALGENCAQI